MTSRWQRLAGDDAVEDYDRVVAARLARVDQAGGTVHAEAELVAELCEQEGKVLDAGCGTGRVTWRLAELGLTVTGVDSDPRMLHRARRAHHDHPASTAARPAPSFVEADLASYRGEPVDVVLAAGNVVPLLAPGTLNRTVRALAAQLRPDGLLVWGFGLSAQALPPGCPPTPLRDVELAARAAGLQRLQRWGTWEKEAYTGRYVVEVHERAGRRADGKPAREVTG
ncbi:MAG: class I SAM-dependent methyltransferase [Ornithinimicrobium sp.]